MEKVYVEKYNASDDSYLITEINFEVGSKVEKGDIIFSIESSKADIDVEASSSGYIYYKANLNEEVYVGKLFYIISDNKITDYKSYFIEKQVQNNIEGIIISSKASVLLQKENIDPKKIEKSFIKEKDVIDYITSQKANKKGLSDEILNQLEKLDVKKDIIIIGGRGGCKMVIDAIISSKSHNIRGIIDNEMEVGEQVMGYNIIGNDSNLTELFKLGFKNIVLSFSMLSNLKLRNEKYRYYTDFGFKFPNIIHKHAILESSVILGYGNIILAGSVLGSEVSIGNVNYINTGSIICHESKVGNNNHFAPNSVIAGRVKVGNNVLIGMCATTFFDINIGSNIIINNGVNIVNDVEDNKIIKK
jgi:sugar O-acyltransferase (sialic acid O-acetyltransferase NeuD family)